MGLIIKNIIPVTGNVITPEMVEYTRKYLQPDTELRTVQIKVGPPSIECEYDEAVAGPDVLRLFCVCPEGFCGCAKRQKRRGATASSSTAMEIPR